jgi:hypothetical protein
MADNSGTRQELLQQLHELDAEIAQLQGTYGNAAAGEVRDPEEIATDLTSREEQQAVLGILQRRRETLLDRLKQLGE